jgi:hypothetical protein
MVVRFTTIPMNHRDHDQRARGNPADGGDARRKPPPAGVPRRKNKKASEGNECGVTKRSCEHRPHDPVSTR